MNCGNCVVCGRMWGNVCSYLIILCVRVPRMNKMKRVCPTNLRDAVSYQKTKTTTLRSVYRWLSAFPSKCSPPVDPTVQPRASFARGSLRLAHPRRSCPSGTASSLHNKCDDLLRTALDRTGPNHSVNQLRRTSVRAQGDEDKQRGRNSDSSSRGDATKKKGKACASPQCRIYKKLCQVIWITDSTYITG
jgi:hypothetical protein